MRIGIIPNISPSSGGVYQYSLNILQALNTWSNNGCEDRFVLFSRETPFVSSIRLRPDRWEVTELEKPTFQGRLTDKLRQLVGEGQHREAWRWLRRQFSKSRERCRGVADLPDPDARQSRDDLRERFLRSRVELLLYPYPVTISFETGFPYIIAVHDLQHRIQPEFPEVSANGEWEYREYLFRNACRYATLILADSEIGKEDILHFYSAYGVTPDRVKVLPYLPAAYLAPDVPCTERSRIQNLYRLPERYLFYPAQFWPHKNHARIVQALALLKREYQVEATVVFCGSYEGEIRERTYHNLVSLTRDLEVGDQVQCLGYVPEDHMSAIYAGAVALVMPTFFGPTNIPVLEAWSFGCPVLTSDVRGIREQAGDAAILADPRSVESIAGGIYRLWTDEDTRCALTNAGRRRIASYTPADFRNALSGIVEEAKDRVRAKCDQL